VGNQLGEVLFTKKINLPNKNEGLDLSVNLGQIDDLGRVYFNGDLVWQEIRNSKSYSQIQFTIPAAKIKQDENLIEVKVLNILWGGGLTGPADKMYYTAGANAEKTSLTGDWNYEKIFDLSEVNPIPREGKPLFSTASSLYNGMIYPLLGFTFNGCVWYQGEGNVGDNRYTQMFTDMIEAWRNNFNQNMPFYFVQIAPYNYDNLPQGDKSVLLREMQAKTAKEVPQTYMAVTIDIGDADNIHPAKKKEVGERLALLALSKTYQQNLSCDYPQALNAEYKNKSVIVNLTNTYKGLVLRGDKHELEISNDDKTYFRVQVELNGNQLIASSNLLSNPKYIRYCWHNISRGTIFNSEGLPLTSFKLEIQ
jgi:sialate O-acetylesterase